MPTLRILVRREQSSLFDPGERRPATRAVVEKRVDCLAMTRLYAPTPEEPPKAPGNNTMSKKRQKNAPKTTKPAPKKGSTTTDAAPKDAATTTRPTKAPRERDARIPAVGSKITRSYKGKDYEVTVEPDGFRYVGESFRSLSALARRITGFAAVNGLLWFQLTGSDNAKPAPKDKKPAATTTSGGVNDLASTEGQRAALKAAGLAKTPKGTPEQIASAAKARIARAAKKSATR